MKSSPLSRKGRNWYKVLATSFPSISAHEAGGQSSRHLIFPLTVYGQCRPNHHSWVGWSYRWSRNLEPNFCPGWDFNLWPLEWQSVTLTTKPLDYYAHHSYSLRKDTQRKKISETMMREEYIQWENRICQRLVAVVLWSQTVRDCQRRAFAWPYDGNHRVLSQFAWPLLYNTWKTTLEWGTLWYEMQEYCIMYSTGI